MPLLRLLTLGLLGACLGVLLILVNHRGESHGCAAPRAPAPAAAVANPITIIDLAPAPSGAWSIRDIAEMIRLAPGEDIVAVDDHPVVVRYGCAVAPHDCDGAVLPNGRLVEGLPVAATANRFADFTVASAAASRRVLVLIH